MIANPATSQISKKKKKKTTGSNKLPKYRWIFYLKKPTFLSDLCFLIQVIPFVHH
jgi:hypothetical protein